LIDKLSQLFKNWSGEAIKSIEKLPGSGSVRQYFRIAGSTQHALGVYNPDMIENRAFIKFTEHFIKHGLNVPEIYQVNLDENIYLIEDLGNDNLFSKASGSIVFDDDLFDLYTTVLDDLIKFQWIAGKDFDYSYCYPRAEFDTQSMQWDLNYFKYNFLKLAGISFDEQLLENDFQVLIDYLQEVPANFFMYRDFQSRNIHLKDNIPFYIDYQGGRKGPLQYDVASLLFQVKADIPFEKRKQLLDFYINKLKTFHQFSIDEFKEQFYVFVLLRLLQVLGAYGFRGLHEHKSHFVESIPFAVKNIQWLFENVKLPVDLPCIGDCLSEIINEPRFSFIPKKASNLTVTINSFSFKKGIPEDDSENGGGFVFDCRALPNPGREEQYRSFSGKDDVIIEYLKKHSEVSEFLQNIGNLIDRSVDRYIERNFTHLMVSFGCTGGQHRSVYSAESLYRHLEKKYNINLNINHLEENNWPKQ